MIALAFVAAALLALLSGEAWIRRPVAALQRVVGRMERGDLAARARLERWSSPELHRLAASFNGMASSLQARQAALQEGEARLRAVVDTAADGIITINHRGLIEAVNPAAERLFGYRRDELIGTNVAQLMPSPDRERHDQYLARYLRTGEARIIGIGREVTGQRKDGTTLPLSLSIGEFTLDGGRFFTGILRDITERKRADEHQALLMAEIDHRAKNLLASIQAMVMLTKSTARSVGDYADTLIGRLHAMARAHDLLARDKWTGRARARADPQRVRGLCRRRRPRPPARWRGRAAAAARRADPEPRPARADHQRRQVWRAVGARTAGSRSTPRSSGRPPGASCC